MVRRQSRVPRNRSWRHRCRTVRYDGNPPWRRLLGLAGAMARSRCRHHGSSQFGRLPHDLVVTVHEPLSRSTASARMRVTP